jgi:thiamine kinase-like enzyme
MNTENARPKIFFSYSHHDQALISEIAQKMDKEGKFTILYDDKNFKKTNPDSWQKQAKNLIVSADLVVFFVSDYFLISKSIFEEVDYCVNQVNRRHVKMNIPYCRIHLKNENLFLSQSRLTHDQKIFTSLDPEQYNRANVVDICKQFDDDSLYSASKTLTPEDPGYVDYAIDEIAKAYEKEHQLVLLSDRSSGGQDADGTVFVDQENFYFKSQHDLIHSLTENLVSRKKTLNSIDKFFQTNVSGYLLIKGKTGIGKTTLAASLVDTYSAIHHFAAPVEHRNSVIMMLRSLIEQMDNRLRIDSRSLPEDFATLSSLFVKRLQDLSLLAVNRDRIYLIVLDGIDQMDVASDSAEFSFLPEALPPSIYIFFTNKTDSPLPQRLQAIVNTVTLEPFSMEETAALAKALASNHGNPIAYSTLKELQEWAHGEPSEIKNFLLLSQSQDPVRLLADLKRRTISTIEAVLENASAEERDFLALLIFTYDGVSPVQIKGFCGIDPRRVEALIKAYSNYVYEAYDENQHKKIFLKNEALKRYLCDSENMYGFASDEQEKYRSRILAFFLEKEGKDSPYCQRYLAYHFYDSNKVEDIVAWFEDSSNREAKTQFLFFLFRNEGKDRGVSSAVLTRLFAQSSPHFTEIALQAVQYCIDSASYFEAETILARIKEKSLTENLQNRKSYYEALTLRKNGGHLPEAYAKFIDLSARMSGLERIHAVLQRSNCARELGLVKEAMAGYQEIATEETRKSYPFEYLEAKHGLLDRLYVNGRYKDALEQLQEIEKAYAVQDYPLLLFRFHKMAAQIYGELYEEEAGVEECQKASEIVLTYHLEGRLGEIDNIYSTAYAVDLPELAADFAGKASRINHESGQTIEEGKSVLARGVASLYLRHFKDAKEAIDQALTIFEEAKYKSGQAKAWHEKAKIAFVLGPKEEAITALDRSTELLKRETGFSYPTLVLRNVILKQYFTTQSYNLATIEEGMNAIAPELLSSIQFAPFLSLRDFVKKTIADVEWRHFADLDGILHAFKEGQSGFSVIKATNNDNFVYEDHGANFLIRHHKKDVKVDVHSLKEKDVLILLEKNHFNAPLFLKESEDGQTLLLSYIKGETLFQRYGYEAIGVEATMALANAFKALHRIKGTFSLTQEPSVGATVEDYYQYQLEYLTQAWTSLKARYSALFAALHIPEDPLEVLRGKETELSERPLVLCHCDAHRKNLIYQQESQEVYFIDWELAVVGDPFADLAVHLQKMNYTPEEELLFKKTYFGASYHENDAQIEIYRNLERIKYAIIDLFRLRESVERQEEFNNLALERYLYKYQEAQKLWGLQDTLTIAKLKTALSQVQGAGKL